jgi:hypothetical protein
LSGHDAAMYLSTKCVKMKVQLLGGTLSQEVKDVLNKPLRG